MEKLARLLPVLAAVTIISTSGYPLFDGRKASDHQIFHRKGGGDETVVYLVCRGPSEKCVSGFESTKGTEK